MCGIWVYVEDTQSVTFLTPILLLVNFPVPLLPWVTPQDFAIRDHFFGFSKVRVWGRKKKRESKRRCQRAEKERQRRDSHHRSLLTQHTPASQVFLLFFRHIQFIPTSGPLHFLCSLPLESHIIHLFLRKAIPTAHTASPSCSFCPVPLCSLLLLYFTSQNSLLPEIILFVVITCCLQLLVTGFLATGI